MTASRRGTTQSPDEGRADASIEAHLPLVKHIVFQVAVHFPRHVDRDELARAGALGPGRGGPPLRRVPGRAVRPLRRPAHPGRHPRRRPGRRLGAPLGAQPRPQARGRSSSAWPPSSAGCRPAPRWPRRSGMTPRRAEPPAGPHVPLGRPGPRARGLRGRRRGPHRSSTCSATAAPLEPLEELEPRELHAYLRDAVEPAARAPPPGDRRLLPRGPHLPGAGPLPRRHRVPGLPAALRGAADAEGRHRGPVRPAGPAATPTERVGRVARRKARYASAIRDASGWRSRLEHFAPLPARLAG